jgi:hypothetical protein
MSPVFYLNATAVGPSGPEPPFLPNPAERVDPFEAAHNPEVAGSNPAPATAKGAGNGAFRMQCARYGGIQAAGFAAPLTIWAP